MNLNPGLTGVFNGDHRLIANFRNQWQALPVPYLQLAGSWDWRIRNKEEAQTPWSIGTIFNYDRAGDAELSLAQLGLNGSYSHRISEAKRHFVTIGGNCNFGQRTFDPTGLRYGSQYEVKEGHASTNPSFENFGQTSRSFVDVGIGGNLRIQAHQDSLRHRSKLDLGVGAFHLNEPKRNFEDNVDETLKRRLSVYGLGTLMLSSKFDLLLHAMGQFQGPNQEIVLGAGGLIHLNQKRTQELALQLGLGYRIEDALIPWIALHYQNWQFHVSYDMNTSALNEATNRRGGPEVSVIYIIKQIPTMRYCELCPTYM
jgi:type IX secretion system PorP/SprF family membrane protein